MLSLKRIKGAPAAPFIPKFLACNLADSVPPLHGSNLLPACSRPN